MFKGKKITVVIPVYNEERLIGRVIDSMPGFVDLIIAVDDGSEDMSAEIIRSRMENRGDRLVLIRHGKNRGVGAAIVTGYEKALQEMAGITVVMAGDYQMDPDDLPGLLEPVASGSADYAKGNRFLAKNAWRLIPAWRYVGNLILSLLTKVVSGYWHVSDSQTGYTAISWNALRSLKLNQIYKRYGMPNDMLVHLNVGNWKVRDVHVRPVYNIGEKSGMRLYSVAPMIFFLLFRRFFWRLKEKYMIYENQK